MWNAYKSGKTIGDFGSEQGIIIQDEEHSEGARLTLESDGATAPFSITTGVYGEFFYTTFLSSKKEAESIFKMMKVEIDRYLMSERDSEWVEKFVERY